MSSTNSPTRRRRRRSFGRCFRRPRGRGWLVQFPDPSGRKAPSGRTAYVTRSVASKAEGEALLKEVRRAVLTGSLLSPAEETPTCELTVLETIDAHLESRRGAGCAESTIQIYGYSRTAIERNGLGNMRVADVSACDIERFLTWRASHIWRTRRRPGKPAEAVRVKGGKASAATLGRDRELLCAALNRLIRLGELPTNPVKAVPKPRRPKRKRMVLTKAEVVRLIAACDRFLRPLILTLVYLGCRKSEALALRWRDLDLESRFVSLFRRKVGNVSRLPLHPVLAEELRQVRDRRAADRGRPVPENEHVFLSRYRRPYRHFRTGWMATVERAGLTQKKPTPHCLRHTFSCHFLEGGAAVTDLQAILGHSDLKTTQIYAQMVDQRVRASVEALEF